MRLRVEGHPDKYLLVFPRTSCGSIKDGVGFKHISTKGIDRGGWVVSRKALLKALREGRDEHLRGSRQTSRT